MPKYLNKIKYKTLTWAVQNLLFYLLIEIFRGRLADVLLVVVQVSLGFSE